MDNYYKNSKAPTLGATYNATISSSSSVSIVSGASIIIVTAIDKGIFMKWGGTASSSTFDNFIGVGTCQVFVIPSGTSTVEFIQEAATAKLAVVQK